MDPNSRVGGDLEVLGELLKEKAHLEVKLFKVNKAIDLTRAREAADEELRAFRHAEGV
ncbi:MAG TPA: hypothetical protein VKQ28_00765 [Candidatus Acidoferrum sp.]|nr:hypothetical protein [Candidatus Acidoferrum sp.]